MNYTNYRKKNVQPMRPVTKEEAKLSANDLMEKGISISAADEENGSPKVGDMIAINPNNTKDKWLIAKDFHQENYEIAIEVNPMAMTWAHAKEAIDKGLMVSREGWWADKRYSVFKQIPVTIPIEVVPNMQSLPPSVKDLVLDRTMKSISYQDQIALIDDVNVIRAFNPSIEDLNAEDWYIVN